MITVELDKLAKDVSSEAFNALEKTGTPPLPPYYAKAFSDAMRRYAPEEQSELSKRCSLIDEAAAREIRLEESFVFARKTLNEYSNSVSRLKEQERAFDLSALETDDFVSASILDEMKSYINAVVSETRKAENAIGALESELDVIETRSFVDPLTRLRTRAALKYQLERILQAGCDRDLDLWTALVAIDDYDRLKEELGYVVMEKILLFTAKSLTGMLRSDNRVYRYGEGQENEGAFCVVFNRVDRQEAYFAVKRVSARVESSRLVYKDKVINVTLSAALSPHRAADDWETIRDRAEKTLAKSLSQSKNAVSVFED